MSFLLNSKLRFIVCFITILGTVYYILVQHRLSQLREVHEISYVNVIQLNHDKTNPNYGRVLSSFCFGVVHELTNKFVHDKNLFFPQNELGENYALFKLPAFKFIDLEWLNTILLYEIIIGVLTAWGMFTLFQTFLIRSNALVLTVLFVVLSTFFYDLSPATRLYYPYDSLSSLLLVWFLLFLIRKNYVNAFFFMTLGVLNREAFMFNILLAVPFSWREFKGDFKWLVMLGIAVLVGYEISRGGLFEVFKSTYQRTPYVRWEANSRIIFSPYILNFLFLTSFSLFFFLRNIGVRLFDYRNYVLYHSIILFPIVRLTNIHEFRSYVELFTFNFIVLAFALFRDTTIVKNSGLSLSE